jgi:hypothetical protein
MIMGISFGRGVFFHDRNVLACAEVKRGVIHVWGEKITLLTIAKLWVRVCFSLPWHYHLLHIGFLGYLAAVLMDQHFAVVNPWWIVVYLAGFHFVFPRQLKQFHGAEHKVFSYAGEKNMEALDDIKRANIVNAGCSTNLVVAFFLVFLPSLVFLPLESSVAAAVIGTLLAVWGERYLRRYAGWLYKASALCQLHLTTREPERIHLETAIRSYQMFEHVRQRINQAA